MIGFERSEQRSRFVGRESVLDSLGTVAQGSRLVTVLGAPGIGKTRLVLELGARLNRERPGAVRVVDCARAESARAVADEVGAVLGDEAESPAEKVDAVGRQLGSLGATALVLDNFDLPSESERAFVGRWLGVAPELALVVTTRSRLGRTGEVLFEVGPLEPREAAALFLDRAANVRPNAPFDAEELALVDEIVDELDGMPLAIELAAGRLRVMGVAELRARLDDPLSLLVDGTRKDRGRHRTFEAALEPSWQRLSDDERRALARLAGSSEGLTLGAAEALLRADSKDATALDRIQSLRDQSLLVRDAGDRLRVLAPIAAFVKQRVGAVGTRDASSTDMVLEVGRDGRALRVPGGAWASLPRGSPLGRILLRLVEARIEQPGGAVSLDELVRAGWPDERMLPDAARNRAYMAMSRLRKLGLEPLIVRTEDGYVIPSRVRVEYGEPPRET